MAWLGKNGKNDNLIPLPERAYGGDYCRTSAFNYLESANFTTWWEARKSPLNGRWTIQEITQRPNTVKPDDDEDTVEAVKTIENKKDLTFFEVIAALAVFENSEGKLGKNKIPAPDSETYFQTFAENEGTIIFDKFGKPHPTLNGEVTVDGVFSPEARRLAKEKYNARPGRDYLDPALIDKFNTIAFDDINDLLDQGLIHVKWREFTDALEVLMDKFQNVQKKNFATEEFVRSGWIHHPAVPMYEKAMKEAKDKASGLKKAKGGKTKNPLLDNTQRNLIDRFFKEFELSYEIAQAKYHYIGLSEARANENADEKAKLIRKLTQNAEKIAKNMGQGSGWNVQKINAEIVNGKYATTVYEGNEEEGATPDEYIVYYNPKPLSLFIDSCKELVKKYDEKMGLTPAEETTEEEKPADTAENPPWWIYTNGPKNPPLQPPPPP